MGGAALGDGGLSVWLGGLTACKGAGAWEVGMKVTLFTIGLGGACMHTHTQLHEYKCTDTQTHVHTSTATRKHKYTLIRR